MPCSLVLGKIDKSDLLNMFSLTHIDNTLNPILTWYGVDPKTLINLDYENFKSPNKYRVQIHFAKAFTFYNFTVDC